jgi:hypothetical protein
MQPTPELPSTERDFSMSVTPAPVGKTGAAWFDNFQARNRATLLKVLLGLVVLAFAWWGVQELTKHRTIPAGKAALWSTQLDLAQQMADQKEKGSQLFGVSARHASWSADTYSGTLLLTFDFVAPSGRTIEVDEEDTEPLYAYLVPDDSQSHSPLGTALHTAPGSPPNQTLLALLRTAVSAVKLSPREALEATVPQLKPSSSGGLNGEVDPTVWLLIRGDTPDQIALPGGSPAVWGVFYMDSPEGTVLFNVDATNGKVLEKRYPFGDNPTHTASPPTRTPAP